MPHRIITVAYSAAFEKSALQFWDREELSAFVNYIAQNPTVGDIEPGTQGLRKIRWQYTGSGKRGGVRVIYYYHDDEMPLFLLSAYAKNKTVQLTAEQKASVIQLVTRLKRAYGK